MKKLVVLSGGMDSTTLLYKVAKESGPTNTKAISFNYGSKHNDQEFQRAQASCWKLGVELTRVELPFVNELFSSDLLKSGGDIPEGHYAQSNMKQTVVPFRNGIMLSIAAGFAESIKADEVFIGNHFGDHAVYPDCRKSFIEPMTKAICQGTYDEIKLVSPFCDITKTDIAKLGEQLGVRWSLTYSCYKGGPVHCGRCSTCYERREAFVDAKVEDPTDYIDETPFEGLRTEYKKELERRGEHENRTGRDSSY